jgi:hypothetical protein
MRQLQQIDNLAERASQTDNSQGDGRRKPEERSV